MPDQMTVTHEAAAPAARCPECNGEQLTPHPAGLVFRHQVTCLLLAKEDARVVADKDRGGSFVRPATPTELTLLRATGRELPDDAVTTVSWLSPGVRRRTWGDA